MWSICGHKDCQIFRDLGEFLYRRNQADCSYNNDRTPCTGGGAESVGVASTPLIFTPSELLEWQTRGHDRSRSRAVENFVLLCRNNRYSDSLKGRPSIIDKPPHADRLSGGIVNSTG